MWSFVAVIAGVVVLLVILWDTFVTIVLPRTVRRQLGLTRPFLRSAWKIWSSVAVHIKPSNRRELFLGTFAPAGLLLLITLWAILLLFGFALVQWGCGTVVDAPEGDGRFSTLLYLSGTTFFTLGLGDVTPINDAGRALTVIEAGVGFGFLALVIGYLPVLYGSFSRREVTLAMLDARAGSSPPTAAGLLKEYGQEENRDALESLLRDAERWAAELLEIYTSYPVVAFYRSQHNHQSWLATLTAIMDTSAIIYVGFRDNDLWQRQISRQARLTYKMARHAIKDLADIIGLKPVLPSPVRLPPERWRALHVDLERAGVLLGDVEELERELAELRGEYEPYVNALAEDLLLVLPPWNKLSAPNDDEQAIRYSEQHQV